MKKELIIKLSAGTLIFLVIFFLLNCKSREGENKFADLDKSMKDFVRNIDTSEKFLTRAILFKPDDTTIRGNSAVADYFKKTFSGKSKIVSHTLLYRKKAEVNIYDIGYYRLKDNRKIFYFISWTKSGLGWRKEIEVLNEGELHVESAEKEINGRLERFCEIINSTHNLRLLFDELYREKTYFYNKSRLYTGYDEMLIPYKSMKSEYYSIGLASEHLSMVGPGIAYHIGSFTVGDYPGIFVLIWKKDKEGTWRIVLDTNH